MSWRGGARAITMQLLNPTMTLQTCLQARSLKQILVSCSRVKRIACKRKPNPPKSGTECMTRIFFRRPPAGETNSQKRIGRSGTVIRSEGNVILR
jgi:hypothetical protein